jgi:hypothetical protein
LWALLFAAHCANCPSFKDDDWGFWGTRKLADTDESLAHAERVLSRDDHIWEDHFCTKLQEGPYEFFQSVETCVLSIGKIPTPGIHA